MHASVFLAFKGFAALSVYLFNDNRVELTLKSNSGTMGTMTFSEQCQRQFFLSQILLHHLRDNMQVI